MKCVVTGGAGFIGSNLVDQLIDDGNEVHVIDNFSTGKESNCNAKAVYHKKDLADISVFSDLVKILNNTDIVFHLACKARVQPSIHNPLDYEVNNTIGLVNILKSSVDAKVKKIIYSSSSSVYGDSIRMPLKENFKTNPVSPYGAQKLYGEILCKTFSSAYGIETLSLRYFNVYGERQLIDDGPYSTVVGIFLKQRKENLALTIRGSGDQRRDFTYVGDVVRANIFAAKAKTNPGAINIGRGKNSSINQIASYFGGPIKYVNSVKEPFETLADIQKAKKVLNWEPLQNIKSWIQEVTSSLNE